MCTRSLRGALYGALIAASLLGAASRSSAAESSIASSGTSSSHEVIAARQAPMEEIIVHGTPLHVDLEMDRLMADVLARMRELNEQLKRSIEIDAASIKPTLWLAPPEVELAGRNEAAADVRG